MAEATGTWLANAETGSVDAFTGTLIESGNTFAAATDVVINGVWSYKSTFGGTTEDAGAYRDMGGLTEIYVRCYFKIISLELADNNDMNLISIRDTNVNGNLLAQVHLYGTGTADQYGCRATFRNNTSIYDRYDQLNGNIFQSGTEFLIEMHWKQGASANGVEEFWIDGVEKYSNSAQTNNNFSVGTIIVGGRHENIPSSGIVYYDDIKADTSYIGAYSDVAVGGISIPKVMAYYTRLHK